MLNVFGGAERVGGAGADVMCTALYAGGDGEWAQFRVHCGSFLVTFRHPSKTNENRQLN